MTRPRPTIIKTSRRAPSKAALEAQQAAAASWAEQIVGQALADLERAGNPIPVTDGLRALVRVIGDQIAKHSTTTIAGCVMFGEGARLVPGWRPEVDSARAIADAAFSKREAA